MPTCCATGGTACTLGRHGQGPIDPGDVPVQLPVGHVRQLDRVSRELLARAWAAGSTHSIFRALWPFVAVSVLVTGGLLTLRLLTSLLFVLAPFLLALLKFEWGWNGAWLLASVWFLVLGL